MKKAAPMVLAIIGMVIVAGCLGSSPEGYGYFREWNGIHIETKPAITGEEVSDVTISYDFDWNDYYALPSNFTIYAIVNEEKCFPCVGMLHEEIPLSDDWGYTITCEFRIKGKVHSIRLVAIADGVVVGNETVWRGSE